MNVEPATSSPTTMPIMDAKAWALLGALSLLWGGSFFFAKVSVAEVPPMTVVLARVAIAAVTLTAVLRVLGDSWPRGGALWRRFLLLGLLNNVIPFSLLFWGQTQIASGLAAILNAATPISTVLIAHVLTKDERLTASKVVGIALGVFGVAMMVGLDVLDGVGVSVLAQLACLGATISYGLAVVFGRSFRGLGVSPRQTAFGQVVASTILMLPIVTIIDQPWTLPVPGLPVWLALLALGVFSTGLAYVMYFSLIARAGATNAALVTLLVPVSAVLLGALLGETLHLVQAAGMALIATGLLIMDGRLLRLLAR